MGDGGGAGVGRLQRALMVVMTAARAFAWPF